MCNLLVKGPARRANNDVAQGDIAVRKRCIELLDAQEDLSQAFSDCGDGVCGNVATLGRVG